MSATATGPPPPNESRGPTLIILSTILHAISLPLLTTRIWTRSRPTLRLWWDDYTILAAASFDLLNWILILLAVHHGLGRPGPYVPLASQPLGRKYLYFGQHASGWAIALIKISIALMLLRLRPDSLRWRLFLLAMMFLPVAIAATTSGVLFSACKPLSAMWEFDPTAVCLPLGLISQSILATAAVTIVTDFVLSLLPLTFIVRIQRATREKVLLSFLMGLGLVASAASVCKIVSVTSRSLTGDTLMDGVDVTFWGILENQLGIIAACVPCLRRVIESALHRLGLVSSHGPTIYHMDREESAVARNQNMRVTQEGRTPYENDTDREGAVGWEMTPQGSAVGIPSPPSWDVLDVK